MGRVVTALGGPCEEVRGSLEEVSLYVFGFCLICVLCVGCICLIYLCLMYVFDVLQDLQLKCVDLFVRNVTIQGFDGMFGFVTRDMTEDPTFEHMFTCHLAGMDSAEKLTRKVHFTFKVLFDVSFVDCGQRLALSIKWLSCCLLVTTY